MNQIIFTRKYFGLCIFPFATFKQRNDTLKEWHVIWIIEIESIEKYLKKFHFQYQPSLRISADYCFRFGFQTVEPACANTKWPLTKSKRRKPAVRVCAHAINNSSPLQWHTYSMCQLTETITRCLCTRLPNVTMATRFKGSSHHGNWKIRFRKFSCCARFISVSIFPIYILLT